MARRTLTYWRAQWLGGEVPQHRTLEGVLSALLEAFPSAQASRVVRGDGSIVEIRHRRSDPRPLLLHCAAYQPGAEGSVVPHGQHGPVAPLRAIPPPDDADFLTGALMALVVGDHCLLCSDGLTHGALRAYIQQLVIRRNLPQEAQRLDFAAVANRERLQEIISTGVQEIGLRATLDELDDDNRPDGLVGRMKAELRETVMTLIARDAEVGDLLDQDFSNINAKLVISLLQRGGRVTQEEFDRTARVAAEDEDPSLYIRLRSGSRIDANNIKLSKKMDVRTMGSAVDHGDAWLKLEEYYAELLAAGYIVL